MHWHCQPTGTRTLSNRHIHRASNRTCGSLQKSVIWSASLSAFFVIWRKYCVLVYYIKSRRSTCYEAHYPKWAKAHYELPNDEMIQCRIVWTWFGTAWTNSLWSATSRIRFDIISTPFQRRKPHTSELRLHARDHNLSRARLAAKSTLTNDL